MKYLNTTTVTTHTAQITAKDIYEAFDLPRDAQVTFAIPGGGDWSGMSVDIDHNNVLEVKWTSTDPYPPVETKAIPPAKRVTIVEASAEGVILSDGSILEGVTDLNVLEGAGVRIVKMRVQIERDDPTPQRRKR